MSETGKQKIELDSPGGRVALAKRIGEDIDEYCVKAYDDGHRNHLGVSLIGHNCKRYLWYIFRWCFREEFNGQQQRLFNRGRLEEARFIEWLRGIGAEVWDCDLTTDPLLYIQEFDRYEYESKLKAQNFEFENYTINTISSQDFEAIEDAKLHGVKLKQFRVSSVMGHFGGSLDGIVKLPKHYSINEPVLVEFKTNSTGATFNKLCDNGMAVTKPQHFAQTSTYGSDSNYGFRYVLYLNINKNDDSIHIELVKLDHKLGRQMRDKAEQIILSQETPPRLSDNPTFKDCQYCTAKNICHKGAISEKNCRSCKAARPVENAQWFCDVHNSVIPSEFIPQACPSYYPITANNKNV